MASNSDDFYKRLEVARDADAETLKGAYRKLAMKHHPDRNGGSKQAEAIFKGISEAYDTLKDPQKRAAYDRFGAAGLGNASHSHFYAGAGRGNTQTVDDLFRQIFGADYENLMKGHGSKPKDGWEDIFRRGNDFGEGQHDFSTRPAPENKSGWEHIFSRGSKSSTPFTSKAEVHRAAHGNTDDFLNRSWETLRETEEALRDGERVMAESEDFLRRYDASERAANRRGLLVLAGAAVAGVGIYAYNKVKEMKKPQPAPQPVAGPADWRQRLDAMPPFPQSAQRG